ncbi:MAG: hypothetical protein Q9223_007445 [Gallowayella weberi]
MTIWFPHSCSLRPIERDQGQDSATHKNPIIAHFRTTAKVLNTAQPQPLPHDFDSAFPWAYITDMAPKAERGSTVESFHSLRRSSRIQKPNNSTEQRPETRSQASISSAAKTAKITIAASESATADPKPFPFLCLPAEIRNMIYRYVVRFPKGVVRLTRTQVMWGFAELQLWYVNRQFYDEASAIFYHINTFKFNSREVVYGNDPFGPRLDRIERCYLHLAGTEDTEREEAFNQRFVHDFATALLSWKNPKYLVVRVSDFQFELIKPLEWLAGIDFVMIDTPHFTSFPPWSYFSTRQVTSREQRLERLMMSDGNSENAIMESLGEVYVSDPPLSTQLSGPALQNAKRCGGWANDDQLYDFLGVKEPYPVNSNVKLF